MSVEYCNAERCTRSPVVREHAGNTLRGCFGTRDTRARRGDVPAAPKREGRQHAAPAKIYAVNKERTRAVTRWLSLSRTVLSPVSEPVRLGRIAHTQTAGIHSVEESTDGSGAPDAAAGLAEIYLPARSPLSRAARRSSYQPALRPSPIFPSSATALSLCQQA